MLPLNFAVNSYNVNALQAELVYFILPTAKKCHEDIELQMITLRPSLNWIPLNTAKVLYKAEVCFDVCCPIVKLP